MNETLRLIGHPACLEHRPPTGHPESPDRLRAVLKALAAAGFPAEDAPAADQAFITGIHPAEYWQALVTREPVAGAMPQALDADTYLSHGTIAALRHSAGALQAAVEGVFETAARRVFCAVRPPGHHAGRARPMGFCLLNPIACAADFALRQGARRVAIADFDVHHGNGTQDIFGREPAVFYASSHQAPLYPGTGHEDETGVGNLCNRTRPPGAGSTEFRAVWADALLPRIADFKPDLILVSAGFDAHRDDPLAEWQLDAEDFGWIGERLAALADDCAAGRLVAMLEGGYHPAALAASCTAFVRALSGVRAVPE